MTRIGITMLVAGALCLAFAGAGCGKEEKSAEKSASAEKSGPDERTNEALEHIDKLSKGASVYYSTPHVLSTGQKVPCQFPASAKSSPAPTCCDKSVDKNGEGRCDVGTFDLNNQSWNALSWQLTDKHHYVYEIKSSGTLKDAKMEIFAYGDLDCDGKMSTFKRTILGDPQDNFAECMVQNLGPIEKITQDE